MNAFSPLRASELQKSILLRENVVNKGENPFIERKQRSQRRKRDYPAKTSLAKTCTRLSRENVARKIENVACKVENAFIERKRRSQSQKRAYRAKPSHEKAKTPLPIENVSTEPKPLYPSENVARSS